uniref:Uncharacterized protein n=1 Tax=Romanomermis culicivorax TaxID=13658 RepID=A0A915IL59_ROMCU
MSIHDDEDPSLLTKKVYDDPKCLQAAITSAMKSGLMTCLNDLLCFLLSPIYKLEVRAHLDAKNDLLQTTIVDSSWLNKLTVTMPLTAAIASPYLAAKFA